jgi:hypothetical protein
MVVVFSVKRNLVGIMSTSYAIKTALEHSGEVIYLPKVRLVGLLANAGS